MIGSDVAKLCMQSAIMNLNFKSPLFCPPAKSSERRARIAFFFAKIKKKEGEKEKKKRRTEALI